MRPAVYLLSVILEPSSHSQTVRKPSDSVGPVSPRTGLGAVADADVGADSTAEQTTTKTKRQIKACDERYYFTVGSRAEDLTHKRRNMRERKRCTSRRRVIIKWRGCLVRPLVSLPELIWSGSAELLGGGERQMGGEGDTIRWAWGQKTDPVLFCRQDQGFLCGYSIVRGH